MTAYWTARGLLGLQQVHDFIAKDQPLNAQRFIDRLTRYVDEVADSPRFVGRAVPEYHRDDIRENFFEEAYRIIYRVRADRIDILTVRHGSRLLPARLRDL